LFLRQTKLSLKINGLKEMGAKTAHCVLTCVALDALCSELGKAEFDEFGDKKNEHRIQSDFSE